MRQKLSGLWYSASGRLSEVYSMWHVTGLGWHTVAIMVMLVDMIVQTWSLVHAQQHVLVMSYGPRVDNSNCGLWRNGRQLDLVEIESLTKICQHSLQSASNQLRPDVWILDLHLIVMMAMVMVMVMELVMITILSEVMRQVAWQCECQHHRFHRLQVSH